jgi:hypothetical protein
MGTIINTVKWADNTADLTKNLKAGLDQIDATTAGVKKLVASFEGDKVMANAQRWTVAVQQIGGVTKLTAAEQERYNAVLDKAIEKFTALGKPVPALIQNYSDLVKLNIAATKSAGDAATATDNLAASHSKLGEYLRLNVPLFAGVSARITDNIAAFGSLGLAIGAAGIAFEGIKKGLNVGVEVGEEAKALRNLSTETGVGVENLQALGAATDDFGVSTEEVARSIYNLSRRIAGGDGAAAGALGVLGLSLKELQGLAPDQIFTKVVTAVNALSDPLERAAMMSQLFGGKFGQALLAIGPDLDKLVAKAKDSGEVMSKGAVDGAARFADAIDHLGRQVTTFRNEILAPLLAGLADFIDKATAVQHVPGFKIPEQPGPLVRNMPFNQAPGPVAFNVPGLNLGTTSQDIANLKILQNVLGTLKETYVPLTAVQQQFLNGVVAIGGAELLSSAKVKAGADALKITAEQLAAYTKSAKEAEAANKEWQKANDAMKDSAEGFGHTLESINGTTVEAIKFYLQAGVSQETLAKWYGLTANQIKAVATEMSVENELAKINSTVTIADAAAFAKLGGTIDEQTIPALERLFNLREELNKIENGIKVGTVDVSALQLDVETIAKLKEAFEKAEKAQQLLRQGLGNLHQSFTELSQATSGAFSNVVGEIAKVIKGVETAEGAMHALATTTNASGLQMIASLTSVVAIIYEIGTTLMQIIPTWGDFTGATKVQNFKSLSDFIQSLGLTAEEFVAKAKTAGIDLQKVFADQHDAKKFQADLEAIKRAFEELDKAAQHTKDLLAEASSEFGPSQTDKDAAVKHAKEIFDAMLSAGTYTADQLDKAYYAWQKAMADAGDVAAQAWIKARDAAAGAVSTGTHALDSALGKAETELQGLIAKHDSLTQSISAEAPEAVMGVIETQQRAELKALDDQIAEKAKAYEQLAKDTGQSMADAIVEALKRIQLDPLHLGVILDVGGGYTPANGNTGVAGGVDRGGPTPANPYAGLDYQTYFRDYWAPDRNTVLAGIPHAATGGMVTDWGISQFMTGLSRGSDTVPVMLSPGEMVLTQDQQASIGDWSNTPIHVTVQSLIDGQIVAENTVTRMARNKRGVGTKAKRALGVA